MRGSARYVDLEVFGSIFEGREIHRDFQHRENPTDVKKSYLIKRWT